MSDEAALLAAIRDNPDEDTPRLAYADWLQEHRDANRAEFIRAQCQAFRLPLGDKERKKLEKKAEALFKANKAEWGGIVWKKFHSTKPAVSHCHIERGFITSLKGTTEDIVKHAADIERLAPCLRSLHTTRTNEHASKVLDLPLLRRVRELTLDWLDMPSYRQFRNYPAWGQLDRLHLGFEFKSEAENLTGLAEAPLVVAARRLDLEYGYFLRDNAPSHVGQEAAQAPSLREMSKLKLPQLRGFGFWGLMPASAPVMVKWAGFAKLDWLIFETAALDDDVIEPLLTAATLPRLQRLHLNENSLNDVSARVVAECPQLSELRELHLDWNRFTDAGARLLSLSTTLPAQLKLSVGFNHLTKRGVDQLRERFGSEVVSEKQY
ncbi:MAG: TIGR02996 domain-containing protein [Planctomycetes bacterium]|nr:TIGR02996 domain-containing protein [Planctomycetota bacterium]